MTEVWEDHWVEHPQATKMLAVLADLIDNRPRVRRPSNLLAMGSSGIGKTTILETFAELYPVHRDGENRPVRPVLYAKMAEQGSLADFWEQLLIKCGVTYRVDGSIRAGPCAVFRCE